MKRIAYYVIDDYSVFLVDGSLSDHDPSNSVDFSFRVRIDDLNTG